MHYYKKNLGDYAKKAGRLSILQHGVYNLLIDACYDRERFPTREDALDWVWASTPDEENAVDFVLKKFFDLDQETGVYTQNRIAEEIEDYQRKAETNKRIANERETKRKKKGTNRAQDVNEAPPNHKPLTKNQEPETKGIKYTPEFDTVWAAYPKRAGGNNKKLAFKAWQARLKAKTDPAVIAAGVSRYANFCQVTGKVGTEYVKQASTFFGPDEHYNEPWSIPDESSGSVSGQHRLSKSERTKQAVADYIANG